MSATQLAYQVLKYRERSGWSHKDALRLSHAKATGTVQDVLHYAVKGWDSIGPDAPEQPHLKQIWAAEKAKKAATVEEIVGLIREFDLPRECIPTVFLKEKLVWKALLEKMPMTAMIRNLATMSRVGLLTPLSDASQTVVAALRSPERVIKARIHPIQVLSALRTYSNGGRPSAYVKSQGGEFTPLDTVKAALNEAFYSSFGSVTATGKRTLLALDTSGSMGSGVIAGVPGLTPRDACAAMALVTARSEWSGDTIKFPMYHCINFTTSVKEFPLAPTESLETVIKRMEQQIYGGTDCSAPMIWALNNNVPVDTFIIYTDGETWAGNIHPSQALRQYRQKMGIDARLIVVAFTSTGFSLADPNDPGMLDVVGFDTAAPQLISEFSRGNI